MKTQLLLTLDALKAAGTTGVHSFDLNRIAHTTRAAARIWELKKLGYTIDVKHGVKMGHSVGCVYILRDTRHPEKKAVAPTDTRPFHYEYVIENNLGKRIKVYDN